MYVFYLSTYYLFKKKINTFRDLEKCDSSDSSSFVWLDFLLIFTCQAAGKKGRHSRMLLKCKAVSTRAGEKQF